MTDDLKTVDLIAQIVSAYVRNNRVSAQDVSELIRSVHQALSSLGSGRADLAGETLRPAVPIKKSVSDEYIVCLEDGSKFKSLKRHLHSEHQMSPEEYRAKWNLPHDYPMVAPKYAAHRSQLAKAIGLGKKRPSRKR
jgi:predicted transcriptional regulator